MSLEILEGMWEYSVCTDCYMASGYGAKEAMQTATPEWLEAWQSACERAHGTLEPGYGRSDGHFSHRPCEWCKLPYGGARYPAFIFTR